MDSALAGRACSWAVALRFEAADEAACVRLLRQVRAASERGVHESAVSEVVAV